MKSGPAAGAPEAPTIAIVGCGRIARVHAANLAPHARLLFTSRSPQSAEALAARFRGETLPSFEQALERPDVAAVAICSPLEYHASQTVAALAAGKSVLVEKPMAQSRAEVEAIGRALAGRPAGSLMVAENYLYKPSLRRLRAWLPEIGPLRRVRVSKLTRQQPSDWRVQHGALLEGGVHFVALMGALVREEPTAVRATLPGGEEPERHSFLELDYPSGVRGEIRYSWNTSSLPEGSSSTPSWKASAAASSSKATGCTGRYAPVGEFGFVWAPLRTSWVSRQWPKIPPVGAGSRSPSAFQLRNRATRSGNHFPGL